MSCVHMCKEVIVGGLAPLCHTSFSDVLAEAQVVAGPGSLLGKRDDIVCSIGSKWKLFPVVQGDDFQGPVIDRKARIREGEGSRKTDLAALSRH